MAEGPMRQTIPLADTVRALSGDAEGLAKQLQREREKLEREIHKSLASAGSVDAALTKKLDDLKRREFGARVYADKAASIAGERRSALDARKTMRDFGGVMELASGRVNVGNLQDLSDVMQDTGAFAARKGAVRLGNRLATAGQAVALGISRFAIPIATAVNVAAMGYQIGQWAGKKLFGDPAADDAKRAELRPVWQRVLAAGDRMSSEAHRKLKARAGAFDDPEAMASALINFDAQRNLSGEAWKKLVDETADETKVRAWRWQYQETIDKELSKQAEIRLAGKAAALLKEREIERIRYFKDPKYIRDRAIARERMHALRSLEEEKRTSFDWSGY
jgi:hypothetical protein